MTEEPSKVEQQAPPDSISVEVRWGSPDDIETVFANHLFVSHQGGQFYLVFGELPPPLYIDFHKEVEKETFSREMTIRPVARVAVSPDAMKAFVKAISQNYERFQQLKAQDDEGEG